MGLRDPHPFNFVDPNYNNNNLQIDSRTLLVGAIVFFLLLLSTFSFAYFLYGCIRRGRSAIAGGAANHPQSRAPPPPPGLDKAAINCLPIVSYSGSCRVGECSICLGAFREGEKVKVLPLCHHGFHSECVDKWLRTRSSCPLCRASVVRVDSLAQSDVP